MRSVFERTFSLYKKKLYFAKRQLNIKEGNHIDDDAISNRFSSAHWSRVNAVEYPEYVTFDDITYPDILLFSEGQVMPLDFKVEGPEDEEETIENAAIKLSNQIWDITQAEIPEMSCEDITTEELKNTMPLVVYYGRSETSILPGGPVAHYRKLAAKDQVIHWKEPVQFVVNFDKDCKRDRYMNKDKESFILYVHANDIPFVLEGTGDEVSERMLRHWISTSVTEFNL